MQYLALVLRLLCPDHLAFPLDIFDSVFNVNVEDGQPLQAPCGSLLHVCSSE